MHITTARASALLVLLAACGGGGLIDSTTKDTGPINGGIPNVYIATDTVDFGTVPRN